MPTLHEIFSFVCGQQHNWCVGGEELPFCQRCTGLYVGAVPALLLYALFRPKATNRMLWAHGMFLLLMIPFGYHLVPQTGVVRTLTGQIFAIGLVYYLTLLSSERWSLYRELSRTAEIAYFVACGASLALLLAAVTWGGIRTNTVLSWAGFAGLVIYAAMVLVSVLLLLAYSGQLLRRLIRPAQS